jgi:single-stranded-DNA-specific exonuclease
VKGRFERGWTLRTPDEGAVRAIREHTGLSDISARILVNRGVTDPDGAGTFLAGTLRDLASPFLMKDLDKAAGRVIEAGRRNEPVLIYADYDADGATGAALLQLFLSEAFPGLPVRIHQNHRVQDGYGMRPGHLDAAAAGGVRLVITVDCGISDAEAVRHAAARGMDVIVTDHHFPGDALPPAYAVLNPRRPDCPFPEKELAGVGVAFMLACGVRARMRDAGAFRGEGDEPNLRRYLDLVALGTVADMAPLRGDNRLFVKAGIEEIRLRPRPGIRAVLSVAGISPDAVTEADLGFRVGPRLNAAGRVGESRRSSELLVTGSAETAQRIASELHADNARRQREEDRMLREAEGALSPGPPPEELGAIVLADPGWHLGVLGIVASKLAERYVRPTALLVVEEGEARGSLRSADGFPLLDALSRLSPLLSRYGGHSQAAGVALPAGNLGAFREGLSRIAAEYARERGGTPRTEVDARVRLAEVTDRLMDEFDRLRPFGMGNARPLLVARNLKVESRAVFGGRGQHVRMEVRDGNRRFEAVAFHASAIAAERGGAVDLFFSPERAVFRGNRSIRLLVRGALPARPGGAGTSRLSAGSPAG